MNQSKEMETIKVVQVGMGPLGKKIANFIAERNNVETVAAVDKNPENIGLDIAQTYGDQQLTGVVIESDFGTAVKDKQIDVAILSTFSDMERVTAQIEEIVAHGIPVVSTCEELSYPWDCAPALAQRIDDAAKLHGVAVVGTGVNPGFLMDTLPTVLTTACQRVDSIEINRFQNAQYRRIPFQKKIGAGLTMSAFEVKKAAGTLRHVGLTESMQFIAHRMGWKLDHTEDIINPVIAQEDIVTPYLTIPKGHATGVSQIGRAYSGDDLRISLVFQATVGEPASYDEIFIKGEPDIHSRINGGINGDVATSAVIINTIGSLLRSKPGLQTMADLPLVSYFG